MGCSTFFPFINPIRPMAGIKNLQDKKISINTFFKFTLNASGVKMFALKKDLSKVIILLTLSPIRGSTRMIFSTKVSQVYQTIDTVGVFKTLPSEFFCRLLHNFICVRFSRGTHISRSKQLQSA